VVVVTGRVDLEDFEEADVVVVVVVADCLIGGGGGRPMREEDLAEEDDFVSSFFTKGFVTSSFFEPRETQFPSAFEDFSLLASDTEAPPDLASEADLFLFATSPRTARPERFERKDIFIID